MWKWEELAALGPLRWPSAATHWLAFVPLLLLSVVVGVVSAVVSSIFWLPSLLIALAPVAIAASCWIGP